MGEWKETRFSEIATVIMGQSPASEFYNSDGKGLPFMQGNRTFGDRYPTIDTYTTQITKKAPQNSILMSVRAPVGDINIAPLEMCIGRGLCAINAKDGNNEFVRYLLSYNMPKLKSSENGTTFTAINGDNIKNLKILVPDPPTQKRIADILSAYDDLIENNNRRIALLEKAAQELYKEWFVRFRFPGYEATKFENGLPYGWEFKKLSQISDFVYGKMPKADLISGTGYPIFSGYRVSGYYPEYMYEDRQLVLIARGVGGTGDVKISPPKSYITNLSIVFLLKNNVYRQYLYHTYSLKNLRYLDTGAAQSQITIENLKRVKVICPEVTILEKFNGFVLDIERQIQKLLDKNKNLAKQQDLLLPRLLSGKLEV